jgi:hypothetical protein
VFSRNLVVYGQAEALAEDSPQPDGPVVCSVTLLTRVCAQVTLDPCSKKNENEGTFNQGVFYAGGAQYEAD